MSIQSSEQTSLTSYRLVYTGDGEDTLPTEWPMGETSGDIDLHAPEWGGKGTETKSNRLCFLFLTNAVGNADVEIMAACQGGPKEYICDLDMAAGGGEDGDGNHWVNRITLTASEHLAEDCIIVAGGEGDLNSPAKFGFDAIGYQFISFYTSGFDGKVTELKIYARYF